MTENKGLSYVAFMSIIDSMEEIIGINGKNAILRYTGFEKLIGNPLEYTTEKRMTVEDGHKLYMGIREIIGNKGYNPLMYRGGILTTKNVLSHSEGLRALADLEGDALEKLNQLYSAYIYTIGLKPEDVMEFNTEKKEILIHRRPSCNECDFVLKRKDMLEEIKRPGCANVLAAVYSVGNLRPDLVTVEADEIKCSLIGDDECLFRAVYEIK